MDRFQRRLNCYEQRVGGPAAPESARLIGSDVLPVWLLGEDRTDVERVLSFAQFDVTSGAGNFPRGVLKARSAPLWIERVAASRPGGAYALGIYFEDDDELGTSGGPNITTSDGSESPAVVSASQAAGPVGPLGFENAGGVSTQIELAGFVLPQGRQLVLQHDVAASRLVGWFCFRPMERET